MLGIGFQCYFWHFGEFPNVDQIWSFGPLIYCRNTLNQYMKFQNTFETRVLQLWEYIFEKLGIACINVFEIVYFEMLRFWKFETLERWTRNFLKLRNFGFWNVGIWNFEISKLWNSETSIFKMFLKVWKSPLSLTSKPACRIFLGL